LCRAQYIELDATFTVGRPFVAIVPTAVVNNCGIPLGLVLTPTERAASYDVLWREMGLDAEGLRNVFGRPLLSDGGLGLKAYGRQHDAHYGCFRHFLEGLGSRTYVAMLARRLMFAATERQYVTMRAQAAVSLALGVRAEIVSVRGAHLFAKMFGLSAGADGEMRLLDEDPFRHEALWGPRGASGVATCSNHVEGVHAQLNRATGSIRLLHRRIKEVVSVLTAKAAMFRLDAFRSARTKFNELARLALAADFDPVVIPVTVAGARFTPLDSGLCVSPAPIPF
jgi:hypothetical protein